MNKIKVIFWDLDNTLWSGVIAETEPKINLDLFNMIDKLNKRGIVNSIVSHNEFGDIKRFMSSMGYWDLFVFPKISWAKKAPQILKTLDQMHLRPANALFIDDRQHNLDEAKFFISDINVLNPKDVDILSILEDISDKCGKNDSKLTRFNQYKILESKTIEVEKKYVDNELAFLIQSEIKIMFENCLDNLDRIYELVSRTNQLNYTKNRDSKEELRSLISDSAYESHLISVKDKYGDYGIVGFVVFNRQEVKHFVFSCRILNMGIESFVFHKLNVPDFDVSGEVAYKVSEDVPNWIVVENFERKKEIKKVKDSKSLLVGGCDLSQMLPFLKGNFDKHFNYISSSNRKLEVHRDSIDILLSDTLDKQDIEYILSTCPFLDKECFVLPNFSKYSTIVYSPLIDYVQGKYVSKHIKNYYVSCNPFLSDGVLDEKKINFIYRTKGITRDQAIKFYTNWEYKDKPNLIYMEQLRRLFGKFQHARVFILLGATDTCSDLDVNRFEKHKSMNFIIESVASEYDNVKLLYPDNYIKSKSDFTNSIRHYTKNIYHALATEVQELINKRN
jgi:FkbH-like protein